MAASAKLDFSADGNSCLKNFPDNEPESFLGRKIRSSSTPRRAGIFLTKNKSSLDFLSQTLERGVTSRKNKINNTVSSQQQNFDNRDEKNGSLKPMLTSCKSSSFILDNSNGGENSPLRSLKKSQLMKSAVKAVKGRLKKGKKSEKEKMTNAVKPASSNATKLAGLEKDLDVSLKYLIDVVEKGQRSMLAGSAAIVLDTVVKFLLFINEKTKLRQNANNDRSSSDSDDLIMLKYYDGIYNSLAEVLKNADDFLLVTKNEEEKAENLAAEIKKQSAILRCSISRLIDKCFREDLISNLSSHNKTSGNDSGPESCREFPKSRPDSMYSSGESLLGTEELAPKNSTPKISEEKSKSFNFRNESENIQKSLAKVMDKSLQCVSSENSLRDKENDMFTMKTEINENCDNDGETDQQVFTEECEEVQGDKIVKTKKITTRKIIKKTIVTTKQSVLTSENGNFPSIDDELILNELLKSQAQQKSQNNSGDEPTTELKITSTENFKISGSNKLQDKLSMTSSMTSQKTENADFSDNAGQSMNSGVNCETLSASKKIGNNNLAVGYPVKEGFGFDWSSDSGRPNSGECSSEKSASSKETDAEEETDACGNLISTTQVCEQNIMRQSCSVQSISHKAILNGRIIASQSKEEGQSSLLKASKSDTFKNGVLVEATGDGSFVENKWQSRDNSLIDKNGDNKGDDDIYDEESNSGKNWGNSRPQLTGVLSYVRLFGAGEGCLNACSLASYAQLRDKWRTHESSEHRSAFSYRFAPSPAQSAQKSSQATNSGWWSSSWSAAPNGQSGDEWEKYIANWRKGSTAPRDMTSNKGARDEYSGLIEFLEMDKKFQFPGFLTTPKHMTNQNNLPFHKPLGLTFVNFLDEVDTKRFLVLNNKYETEDGPEVKGGPLDALIVYATNAGNQPKGFLYQEAFLNTYRTFISPVDLLTKLIYRYEKFFESCQKYKNSDAKQSEQDRAAKTTFSLLVCVVDDLSPVDLTNNLLATLSKFSCRLIRFGQLNLARYLRQRLGNRLELNHEFSTNLETIQLLPSPQATIFVTNKCHHQKILLDFKSELLAEQFVYLDWHYFKKIELSEMLLWAQQQTEEHSPNLAAFTAHFNKMSYWVRTKILQFSDARDRETMFAKFLRVMHHLRLMGNFNSLFAMLSALDSGSIRRLSWPKSMSDTLAQYSSLTDSSQSFKAYRQALADTKPPCLPYIGIILQDLTFVHIGNPNFLPESQCDGRRDVINLLKRWQQHSILDNMRRFKAWPYDIKKNDQVLNHLNNFVDHLSEEELWCRSEQIKPKQKKRTS